MSGHPVNIAPNPSLDLGTFSQVPQSLSPVLDEVGTNSWSSDDLAYTVQAQVDTKAFPLGLGPSIQPILLQVIRKGTGTLHSEIPFADIHKESLNFPVVHFSLSKGSSFRTTFMGSTNQSSLQECEGVWSVVPPTPNEDTNPNAVDDRIRDLLQERPLRNVSLDCSHRYTPVYTTSPHFLESPTPPVISCGQTVVPDRASRGRSHQFQNTGRNLAAAFSHPSLRPAEITGPVQSRYSCGICKLDYAQPQGLTRHQREKHKARLCMYCREFAWARPYLFGNHLVRRHPGIDPNAAINEATRSRRSTTIKKTNQPQQPFPIPITEHDGWDRTKFRARSSRFTSSPSAVAKLTPFIPPDVHPLELLNDSDNHTTSPSTEERVQPSTNLGASARTVQIWIEDRGQGVSAVEFTDSDSPSTLETAPSFAPTPPVSGPGGSPAIMSPMVEPSGHTYSCHSPEALAMPRSGRAPAPSFQIGRSWADIYPLGGWT